MWCSLIENFTAQENNCFRSRLLNNTKENAYDFSSKSIRWSLLLIFNCPKPLKSNVTSLKLMLFLMVIIFMLTERKANRI